MTELLEDERHEIKKIPQGYLLKEQIFNAQRGRDFVYHDSNGDAHPCTGVSIDVYDYYFTLWENCTVFGLPDPKGWAYCPEWLLRFLKQSNKVYETVKAWRQAQH